MKLDSIQREESVASLKKELNGDLSILSIINYLEKRAYIGHPGGLGNHADNVNKEALRLAATYLRDYLNTMEGEI